MPVFLASSLGSWHPRDVEESSLPVPPTYLQSRSFLGRGLLPTWGHGQAPPRTGTRSLPSSTQLSLPCSTLWSTLRNKEVMGQWGSSWRDMSGALDPLKFLEIRAWSLEIFKEEGSAGVPALGGVGASSRAQGSDLLLRAWLLGPVLTALTWLVCRYKAGETCTWGRLRRCPFCAMIEQFWSFMRFRVPSWATIPVDSVSPSSPRLLTGSLSLSHQSPPLPHELLYFRCEVWPGVGTGQGIVDLALAVQVPSRAWCCLRTGSIWLVTLLWLTGSLPGSRRCWYSLLSFFLTHGLTSSSSPLILG